MPLPNNRISQELSKISKSFKGLSLQFEENGLLKSLLDLSGAILEVDKSFSQSWIGYHSSLYYKDFQEPPPGCYFDVLQGNLPFSLNTFNAWVQYKPEQVKEYILRKCNLSDKEVNVILSFGVEIKEKFEDLKDSLISILSLDLFKSDEFLNENLIKIKNANILSASDLINQCRPQKVVTRDLIALGQQMRVPAHVSFAGDIMPIKSIYDKCSQIARIAEVCSSHVDRKRTVFSPGTHGNKIFIGHGGSAVWRQLKDLLQDRLHLEWEEFNRVSPAGIPHTVRLSQMLDNACFAFLVFTAEDELADGETQARMNVVHEAGLFQGHLGFNKAIILLEDGCKEFSNIQGLGHIKFPAGDIRPATEEIRSVLERENII